MGEIGDGSHEESRIVAGMAEHPVADLAEQPADLAGFMVVVDSEAAALSRRPLADGTGAPLRHVEPRVVLEGDSVGIENVRGVGGF
jgi:hypothetical protein